MTSSWELEVALSDERSVTLLVVATVVSFLSALYLLITFLSGTTFSHGGMSLAGWLGIVLCGVSIGLAWIAAFRAWLSRKRPDNQ
jgi:uncharacterized membrane protein